MYSHLQLNTDNTFYRYIVAGELVAWDANNYCTAFALEKDGKAEQFRVYLFYTAAQPWFDPVTQDVTEIASALVDGKWTQQWQIIDLTLEQIAANIEAKNEALIRDVQTQTQARLDAFASTRNYAGILSACTYATSTVPKFQAEGQYCVEARDTTWAQLYEILAEVQAGTRPVPAGYSEIESELPVLAWPGN